MLWQHLFSRYFIYYQKEQGPILFSLTLRFLNRTLPKLYFEAGNVEFGKAVLNLPTAISLRNEHCPQNFNKNNNKKWKEYVREKKQPSFVLESHTKIFQVGRLRCQTVI